MLFDLRGRGRRRVVQTIYLFLAVLMGGGLVLFGVGGNTNGGLFDAFSSNKGNGSQTTSFTKQIKATEKTIQLNPKDQASYARLASLRLAEGGANGGFNGKPAGTSDFRQASAAWQKYLALQPAKIDQSVARQMINVYGTSGLNQPDKAVGVMDLLIDQTSPPTADLYKQYALLAYSAGQTRKGDLAVNKAVELSPSADRKSVRSALESIKAQAAAAATGSRTPGAATQTTPAG
jgi:tetratricopeptide (TPR) repeat protein